ncbi:MAG: glycoside hydrolase family 2 [Clostridiales bacterium]|nr:glycoside hydrolase family 2 [Clostridiales bacterium]
MSLRLLKTVWGESLSDKPLQEYPRPQFERKSYVNLNGYWDYAITKSDAIPANFDGKILVPFSPESILSGVNRQLKPNEYLYYRTIFTLPKGFTRDIVLLNFGAVDQVCDVYVNGVHIGHHEGGYNSFSMDITFALAEVDNELLVRVRDFTDTSYHTCGKQSTRRGGMWYTPQSGIWQTVWLESVPAQYISGMRITPDFDKAQVTIEADCNFDEPITVKVFDGDKEIAQNDGVGTVTIAFPNGKFKPWTPENPHLYNLKVISRRDWVESYFGMRKFGCEKVGNYYRLMLNNKPYFHNGLLDQGYYSDGLYTAPSDEALIFDITTAKELGFNMLRKHIKVEPARWYYHCDRLGMLVWQDMPSGGTRQNKMATLYLPFIGMNKLSDTNYRRNSRASEKSRNQYVEEYAEMINQLYNCVSIAMWVPFNEGWGQFDANKIAALTKDLDNTRTVDHASGWHDQGGGDIKSLHVYFKKVKLPKEKRRAICLTEFGGYSFKDDSHSFNPESTYSYKKFATLHEFNRGIKELYERDVIAHISKGLSATVYTQLTDVEDEVNGLLTYDRKVLKVDGELMRTINSKVNLQRLAELLEKSKGV